MSVSKGFKIKKLFGKSKSFDKECRDADRSDRPEDQRESFRYASTTLPSSPELRSPGDAPFYPDSLPTSPTEKKKKIRFPSLRSRKKSKEKGETFLNSTGDLDSVYSMWVFVSCLLLFHPHFLWTCHKVVKYRQWANLYTSLHTWTGA